MNLAGGDTTQTRLSLVHRPADDTYVLTLEACAGPLDGAGISLEMTPDEFVSLVCQLSALAAKRALA